MILPNSPSAYPTLDEDLIVKCQVCQKQVVMEHLGNNIYQVLFHNDQLGSACNGTSRKALLHKRILN